MAIELKPCPFCGDDKSLTYAIDINQGNKWASVVCGCGVAGPEVRTGYQVTGWEDDAAEEWNTRKTVPIAPAGKDQGEPGGAG